MLSRLKHQLEVHEDLRLRVYDDATGQPVSAGDTLEGHPTIGIGRNLAGKGISEEEAYYLVEQDIKECLDDCQNWDYFDQLTKPRKAVLIDLRFNIGPGGYRSFKQMHAALADGDYDRAGVEMRDSQWYHQVGTRGRRLVAQMRSGAWQIT